MATGRIATIPNQVNNVLGFPFIFRGALDVRATHDQRGDEDGGRARAGRRSPSRTCPSRCCRPTASRACRFGREYIIPKPFDPRVLLWVAPAVAKAAMESGVARASARPRRVPRVRSSAGSARARGDARASWPRAEESPRRIVFPEGDAARDPARCRAVVDEDIARPILLGQPRADRRRAPRELDLDDLASRVEIVQPRESPSYERYVEAFWRAPAAQGGESRLRAPAVMGRRNPFGMMMVKLGDADGLVSGLTMSYPETIRPALQIIGTRRGVRHATGMYIMSRRTAT